MTSSNETEKLADINARRQYMAPTLNDLDDKIGTIVRSIADPPHGSKWTSGQLAEALTDSELIALHAWTEGGDSILRAERQRRADLREDQLRRLRPYALRVDA